MRLGRDKALEKINRQSLIERVIDCLSPLSRGIIVVTAQERVEALASLPLPQPKTKVVVDLYPGKGSLGGIYSGLRLADTFYSLAVACDMPFLNPALLCYLVNLAPGFDLVVPKVKGMLEPLHAIYSKNCLMSMEQLLHQGRLQITEVFSLVKTRYVEDEEVAKFDPEHLSFFNINTEADLKRAKTLIKQGKITSTLSDEL